MTVHEDRIRGRVSFIVLSTTPQRLHQIAPFQKYDVFGPQFEYTKERPHRWKPTRSSDQIILVFAEKGKVLRTTRERPENRPFRVR
jgi:hypothetical protein